MRTGYLAKQFEFMQMDITKPNVKTVNELIQNKFSINLHSDSMRLFWGVFFPDDYLKYVEVLKEMSTENYDDPKYIEKLLPVGSKNFVVTDNLHLSALMKKANFDYLVLDEKIMSENMAFFFPWNHFLHDAFDRKLSQLVDSGVAGKLVDDATFVKRRKVETFDVVLTMDHLDIVFRIWLAGLITALLSFITELITFQLTKKFKNINFYY
jgi:hypothetical protein